MHSGAKQDHKCAVEQLGNNQSRPLELKTLFTMISLPFVPITINLPPFILVHASFVSLYGVKAIFTPKTGCYGVTCLAIGMCYFSTSYMPIEKNQFLYASVPVRLLLGSIAIGRALTMPFTNPKYAGSEEGKAERSELMQIAALDIIGGIFVGWSLNTFGGRIAGY